MHEKKSYSDLFSGDMRRLLAEIAFLAAGYGLYPQARLLFKFLDSSAPDLAYPSVGKALVYLNQGKVTQAIRLLKNKLATDDLTNEEEKATLSCFLGLALSMKGAKKASLEQLQTISNGDKSLPLVQNLARTLINKQLLNR